MTDTLEPRELLRRLGLSEAEIVVYLAMLAGARSAQDIIKVTRAKRPTVYYALGCLEKRGLVGKSGSKGDKRFVVAPPTRLLTIAEERVLEAQKLQEEVEDVAPTLSSHMSQGNKKPVVTFYEGVEAVKGMIMESLYCRKKDINVVMPRENFFRDVGSEFMNVYRAERKRRGIHTRNLRDAPLSPEAFKKYYEGLSEVRILPKVMHGAFNTIMYLYDDKTLTISSLKNAYCVLITSAEYTDTMRAWFAGLWSVSTPHPDVEQSAN
jgi:sugar-specific transcriptional regulator TrmB